MKFLSILCFLMFFTFSASFAQDTEVILGKKSANSFPLIFENYSKKNLEAEWKKFINIFGVKTKKNKDTKEFFSNDVIIKEISSKPIDIYATVFKNKKTSFLTVWFKVDGVFLDPRIHKAESAIINQLLNEFSSIAIFNQLQRQAEYITRAKENNSTTKTREPVEVVIPRKRTSSCNASSAPAEN